MYIIKHFELKDTLFKNLLICLTLVSLSPAKTYCQQPGKVYLDSLLKTTIRNYPLIKAKRLQAQGLQYGVKLKQNGIIPSLNGSYQVDYATYNNITGMVYPQYIIPISGPPSKSNIYSGVPGSAAALNMQWEPVTFGQRETEVELAKSRAETGKADENVTVFKQEVFVINAWLEHLVLKFRPSIMRNPENNNFNYKITKP